MIRMMLMFAVLAGLSISMAACNTTKGAGKDMEKAGQSIENSADKHGAD